METKGMVYLVGAGPGDPSLFTLKGLWCLQNSDVVVYDRLVSEYYLSYCRSDAEIIYAGKETDRHTLPQEEINRLLVELAGEGKTVCRLKGGDPFVFGRGGEEAAALAEAGVPFEIVPGVTSAVAVPAYAGVPVTHRDCASAFRVATGHRRKELGTGQEKLSLSPQETTSVYLMGYENLDAILHALKEEGMQDDTPCALIHWGTRAEQKTVTGTLENIRERAQDAGIGPPSILIVGKVVNLRDRLKWREARPLFGKRILITRAARQAQDFARRIMLLGGEPLNIPTIEIVPPDSYDLLDSALDRIEHYAWVVFTSANAVDFFMKRMRERGLDIRKMRGELAALGPATARALSLLGLQVACQPGEYRAEALLEEMLPRISKGIRILLPRAAEARDVLPAGLRQAGAQVDVVPAYKTMPAGQRHRDLVRDLLLEGRVHYITFTSSSTVRNFAELFDRDELPALLERTKVACIGPVTAGTARHLGIRVDLMAEEYTTDGLLKIIAESGVKEDA